MNRPENERKPVGALTADQLWTELVDDAVNQHATDLVRFTLAIQRIAALRRQPLEDTTQQLFAEVANLTGLPMPMVP